MEGIESSAPPEEVDIGNNVAITLTALDTGRSLYSHFVNTIA
jgi:hypothetical protein